MADELIVVHGTTFEDMADDIHANELTASLKAESKALSTKSGKNYATLDSPTRTPKTGIVILAAPAVPPAGATKICDGKLTFGGQPIDVTAYRLP